MESFDNYRMVIYGTKKASQQHLSRYISPQELKVAVVILGVENGTVEKQDIDIRRRGQPNSYRNEVFDSTPITCRAYDPSSFVLFLPYETDGWNLARKCEVTSTRQSELKKMSILMSYEWKLFLKPERFNTILRGGRVFKQ